MSVRVTVPDHAEIREPITVDDPEFGEYRDAIFWGAAEYLATTATERAAQKTARYEAWRATMREARDAPVIEETPEPAPVEA